MLDFLSEVFNDAAWGVAATIRLEDVLERYGWVATPQELSWSGITYSSWVHSSHGAFSIELEQYNDPDNMHIHVRGIDADGCASIEIGRIYPNNLQKTAISERFSAVMADIAERNAQDEDSEYEYEIEAC